MPTMVPSTVLLEMLKAAARQGLYEAGQLPACDCGGLIRPDIVWFGELLPPQLLKRAWDAATDADLFCSIGTSAAVQPASALADLAKQNGACLVEVNPGTTEMPDRFDEILSGPAGKILPIFCGETGLNIPGLEMVAD